MSQVGKLYQFYFKKIGTKNWLRIIIFTLLISVVGWFVVPGGLQKAVKGIIKTAHEEEFKTATAEQKAEGEKEHGFSNGSRINFGAEERDAVFQGRKNFLEEYVKKLEEGNEEVKNLSLNKKMKLGSLRAANEGDYVVISTPWTANNAFFFQQTEGYTEGKAFGKMLFDISWGNLCSLAVLYGFIFEVFDKTFFLTRREGEEATVLTMTPGVKRSDLFGGKILAFLTFYFLINILLFLIPFGIYYFGLGKASLAWFALLALITIIVGPLLFFCLIFAPYLFLGSLTGQRGIFSTLIAFFPLIGGGIKLISSASGLYTVERIFFDPLGFTIISLVCGVFFLTLYYLRYQEEDLA